MHVKIKQRIPNTSNDVDLRRTLNKNKNKTQIISIPSNLSSNKVFKDHSERLNALIC